MIIGERIYLRAFELEDYKTLTKWRNDRDITKSLGGNYFFVSSEREKKWIENSIFNDEHNLRLAICLNENNEYIGNVNLTNLDWINRNAEFSIFIGEKKYWGKGYATESTKLILDFGFSQRNLYRIYLTVLEDNKSAIHIYNKLGFKTEGVLRKSLFKDNKYHNLIIMSILKEEFENCNYEL
ncbi:MAG TPA: GNAT family N-acetyltransferase [Gallicola sp.]|nr:GNAT family N-acetyltransferase [Gallicola sp.]